MMNYNLTKFKLGLYRYLSVAIKRKVKIMKWFIYSILLCMIFLLIGCSTVSVVMPEYKNKALEAKHIVIAPYSVTISCEDDVVSAFGNGNITDLYKKYFEEQFPEKMKQGSRITQVSFLKGISPDSLTWRELSVRSNELIKMRLPRDGVSMPTDSIASDYILFITEYTINHNFTPISTNSRGGILAGEDNLVHELKFTIWDNTKGNLVSYGRIESKTAFSILRKAKGIWEDCVEELAQEIVKSSPFRIVLKK